MQPTAAAAINLELLPPRPLRQTVNSCSENFPRPSSMTSQFRAVRVSPLHRRVQRHREGPICSLWALAHFVTRPRRLSGFSSSLFGAPGVSSFAGGLGNAVHSFAEPETCVELDRFFSPHDELRRRYERVRSVRLNLSCLYAIPATFLCRASRRFSKFRVIRVRPRVRKPLELLFT